MGGNRLAALQVVSRYPWVPTRRDALVKRPQQVICADGDQPPDGFLELDYLLGHVFFERASV
jgi:hypothetical protein